MSLVTVSNIAIMDNPTNYLRPLRFELEFECLQALDEDLEWRVIWVGSAEDSTQDQILEEVLVGPVSVGVNRFELETPPPNASKIPLEDLKGVTVMLITCSYRDTEFVRVGYYVSCEMPGDNQVGPNGEQLPGLTPDPHQMVRNILADKPRITKFPITWGNDTATPLVDVPSEAKQQFVSTEAPRFGADVMDAD